MVMANIQHINPDGLLQNPAFSQIIITQGPGKTLYIGGQNAVNAQREIIGKGDLQAQTRQVMENLETALRACGASFDHLVKLNIHLVQGQNLLTAFQVSQQFLKTASAPPAITVLVVAGLANPDFLIEIDAIAFLAEE
jgi:enamine deaminase RidA (YjgF/YER057c/UK114 family)